MIHVASHAENTLIRTQLKQNRVLGDMRAADLAELERHLLIVDCDKGDFLLHQGSDIMEQYFILDGILKCVVTDPQSHEMILRFAVEGDIDGSYVAWRLKVPAQYSIVSVTRARVAKLPIPQWVALLDGRAELKARFEFELMHLMSDIMGHAITLHLLDGPGRMHLLRQDPALFMRMSKKELAAYLNLCPETLSRLKHEGEIGMAEK